ncbi:nicotinate phosphoribosyltransferase (plasmid) [Paenibacillus thiaminolyticus]|uniref:nicotinate phosphoribosyltransferase n=1 Tax=Paenibacillus thiaminolyticus TaxID=49283 RepID=UPI00232B7B4C|nr:nicotinate phosphoribosyltransferase [Paenibacillus thiaminolyticus]WCF11766.1 nicotinate phosphoribosyltransferase [Paenibacillus thiaminolyticus]
MSTLSKFIQSGSTQQYPVLDNPVLLCDFYKVAHPVQYPKNTETVFSTWIPRGSRLKNVNKVVTFAIQAFIKKYLIDYFNVHFFGRPKAEIIYEYQEYIYFTLVNPGNIAELTEQELEDEILKVDTSRISELHDLGYMPIKIRALKEGTLVPLRVPMATFVNTDKRFFWLTNYLETLFSNEDWLPVTTATIAWEYLKLFTHYATLTCENLDHIPFQGHDFSMRGMAALEASMAGGAGHLLSFWGTDTCPAINYLRRFYNANYRKEIIGTSVPATEHSVMCANGKNEREVIKRLITEVHPSGIASIVSDTWDFWHLVTKVYPSLKDEIMNRDGKVVIRPDSGDPVLILVGDPNAEVEHVRKGLIECLWDTFGGTINDKGFKVLDPHIGAIYGDSITLERAEHILQGLMKKGFASSNVVLGIGSYTYQYNTRDTFMFAIKASFVIINGEEHLIYKDPKTDDGTKKSLKGLCVVIRDRDGELTVKDGLNAAEHKKYADLDLLEDVFIDGKLVRDQTLSEIRQLLHSQL